MEAQRNVIMDVLDENVLGRVHLVRQRPDEFGFRVYCEAYTRSHPEEHRIFVRDASPCQFIRQVQTLGRTLGVAHESECPCTPVRCSEVQFACVTELLIDFFDDFTVDFAIREHLGQVHVVVVEGGRASEGDNPNLFSFILEYLDLISVLIVLAFPNAFVSEQGVAQPIVMAIGLGHERSDCENPIEILIQVLDPCLAVSGFDDISDYIEVFLINPLGRPLIFSVRVVVPTNPFDFPEQDVLRVISR